MSLKKSKSAASRRRLLRQKKNARSQALKTSVTAAANPNDPIVKENEDIKKSSPFTVSPLSSQHQDSNSIMKGSSMHITTTEPLNGAEKSMNAAPEHSIIENGQLSHALDPATIFPYSNKPHETRKKTIAEESKQWESLFDPQYTFGSFQREIEKPVNQFFYRGKWPLDQEDIIGLVPKVKKNRLDPGDTPLSNEEPATLQFPTVPSPTLPDMKQLEPHINTSLTEREEIDGNRQIEILPCPSLSQFPKYRQIENEELWRDRLELLKMIQVTGFNKELNDGTRDTPYKESTTARLQRQIKKKAEKIKRETLVDSSTEEEEESEAEQKENQIDDDEFHGLNVAIGPDTLLMPFENNINETEVALPLEDEEDLARETSSLATLDDYEKISFHAPKEEGEVEKAESIVEPEVKRKNRPSFLYFAYGFLFPPLWIIGALYVPSSNLERTTASKNIDKKWKKYSRNALFVFLVTVITIIVLLLVSKPEAVGFRNSNEGGYQEERVVFDEDSVIAVTLDTSVVV